MGTPETQMFTIAESTTSLIRVVCQSATVRLQAFTSEGMQEIVLQEDAVKALQHILWQRVHTVRLPKPRLPDVTTVEMGRNATTVNHLKSVASSLIPQNWEDATWGKY